jgi:hypothetical protein
MSSRNGRYLAALGGLILTLSLGIVGNGYAEGGAGGQGVKGGAPAQAAPQNGATTDDGAPYQARCDKPASGDDANYCEQRKAAEAAKDQARWALGQLIVGVLGTAAVVGSLFYTAKAALAADAAAKAAQSAVDETRATARTELRAYITMDVGRFGHQDGGTGFKYEARPLVRNAGSTPARSLRHSSEVKFLSDPLPSGFKPSVAEDPDATTTTLGGGHTVEAIKVMDGLLTDSELEEWKGHRGRKIYVFGTVYYEDVFGEPHVTDYGFKLLWGDPLPQWLVIDKPCRAT